MTVPLFGIDQSISQGTEGEEWQINCELLSHISCVFRAATIEIYMPIMPHYNWPGDNLKLRQEKCLNVLHNFSGVGASRRDIFTCQFKVKVNAQLCYSLSNLSMQLHIALPTWIKFKTIVHTNLGIFENIYIYIHEHIQNLKIFQKNNLWFENFSHFSKPGLVEDNKTNA